MVKFLLRLWRKYQRKTDLEILWPTCKARAQNLDHAKAAFAVHCFADSAWTADYNDRELAEFIDALF